jgi:hypothetical protein
MNVYDGWVSEYRKNKYFLNKEIKEYKNSCMYDKEFEDNIPKTIAVMLDLDGTSDFINKDNSKVFIRQLEILRRKFKAEKCTISISTHYSGDDAINKIKSVLDVINNYIFENIIFGINFFYGGTYNYNTGEVVYRGEGFNRKKIDEFTEFYVKSHNKNRFLEEEDFKNNWFAIIDDNVRDEVYKEYRLKQPMVVIAPSQQEDSLKNNSFMRIGTTTKGFNGVIEALQVYINSIKGLNKNSIMEKQREVMVHLSLNELHNMIINRNYNYLEKYFSSDYLNDFDYIDSVYWIGYSCSDRELSKEELLHLKNILKIISKHFIKKNEKDNLKKVYMLKREIENKNETG